MRAVTADQVLFEECAIAFRSQVEHVKEAGMFDTKCFLLTPFEIEEPWHFNERFYVSKSVVVNLPGARKAIVSEVSYKRSDEIYHSHLFGIALSAIFSFVTLTPCKSTRTDEYNNRGLSANSLPVIALDHPILSAGPGAYHTHISQERALRVKGEIDQLVKHLLSMKVDEYHVAMQAIRLAHLSIVNRRDDFGLAYLLMVSAIESVAQLAIKRDKVKEKDPRTKDWEEKAKSDGSFAELLLAYKDARGKNSYLGERYARFIIDYAPIDRWPDYVDHPFQWIVENYSEAMNSADEFVTRKLWNERYPTELSTLEISDLLKSSYADRSNFVHRGEQPSHQSNSIFRFLEEIIIYPKAGTEGSSTTKLIPKFELISGIAKQSITKWIAEKAHSNK